MMLPPKMHTPEANEARKQAKEAKRILRRKNEVQLIGKAVFFFIIFMIISIALRGLHDL